MPSACVDPASFTAVSFANSTLARANLGNLAGSRLPRANRTDLFLSNVGQYDGGSLALRITNETELRSWSAQRNGLTSDRAFVAINLLAPRAPGQSRHWGTHLTHVVLRLELVDEATRQPARLARSFFSLHDFDTAAHGNAVE